MLGNESGAIHRDRVAGTVPSAGKRPWGRVRGAETLKRVKTSSETLTRRLRSKSERKKLVLVSFGRVVIVIALRSDVIRYLTRLTLFGEPRKLFSYSWL